MALVAILGMTFPADGFEVGKKHIGFSSLQKIVNERNKYVDISENTETPDMSFLHDSVSYYQKLVHNDMLRFWLPSADYFDSFWKKVESARGNNQTVRILHYGDSQIELDHISSNLRAYMQDKFGGGGPGMVPFHTIVPTPTVFQFNAGELIHLASFGDSTVVHSRGDYGVMMQCFRLAGGSASTSVRSSNSDKVDSHAKVFRKATLIFNNRGTSLSATLNDRKHRTSDTQNTNQNGVSSFSWEFDTINSLRVSVSGSADLYCLLLDGGPGVAVDNIPMRGCSGQQFTGVNAAKLTAAYSQMNVGMIIMQFGGNSVPYFKTTKSISDYCTSIGRQIEHVKRCCPQAKILFIGPSDMSTRIRGELQSYPILPELIDSLSATAVRHGAAYWSIYHAMGGHNSMPEWTRQGLAGHDYIHFSDRGAKEIGERLSRAFDNSYNLYKLNRRLRAEKGTKK